MLKFNRTFKAVFTIGKKVNNRPVIDKNDEVVTIYSGKAEGDNTDEYPHGYSMDFRVERTVYSLTGNVGSFRFKNLPKEIQAKLWLDRYQTDKYVDLKLYAGYGKHQPKIFQGLLTQCYSYRNSGEVDFITEIQADNFTNICEAGLMNITMQKSTEFDFLVKAIADFMPGDLKPGYLTKQVPAIQSTTTYRKSPLDILSYDYSGFQTYIDNGEIHVLADNEVIPNDEVQVITAESGLLGSPRRYETYLEVEMIFEPGLIMGQKVQLLSDSMPWFNQVYKVIGISHEGTISPVECGTVKTKVQLWLGTTKFGDLQKANFTYESKVTGEWVYPLSKKVPITSPFGMRNDPFTGKPKMHNGTDLGCAVGTDVLATNNGKVVGHYTENGGYGKYLVISHGKINDIEISSRYAHLSEWLVNDGDTVTRGQVIAKSGNTGGSKGPHLHFEIRENNNPVNANRYVRLK